MRSLPLGPAGRSPAVTLAGVAVGVALALALAAPLVGVAAAGALVVPLAALFGPLGVLGVGAGAATYHAVVAGTPGTVAVAAVGYLAFAAVGAALWETVRREMPALVEGRRWPLAFAGTVAVAALVYAATVGWAATLLSVGAFVSLVPTRAVETLLPAVLLGPPLLYAGARLLDRPVPTGPIPTARRRRFRVAVPALVTVGWVVGGLVLSTLTEDLGYVTDPAALPGPTLPGPLAEVVFAVLVQFGAWTEVLVGAVALALVWWALWPVSVDAPGPERSDGGVSVVREPEADADPYRLSRRDAVLALGALGVVTGGGRVSLTALRQPTPTVDGLVTVAGAVYPSAVTPTAEFVGRYVAGRSRVDPSYLDETERAVWALDQQARLAHGAPLVSLSPGDVESVLRELGVNSARADPDGGTAARIRYYVVDELLFALFTTPVGGRLVGIENPPGYGGGHEAYQHAPEGARGRAR